jgi:glycosyltransferase involved in cell wall biosynthesis
MPVYNPPFLCLTAAINSLLIQTYKDKEIIVIFDGLGLPEYQKFLDEDFGSEVKAYQIPHVGIAGALNYGIERARGRYIVRADADDTSAPDRIALQVEALRLSNASICGSALRIIDSEDKYLQGDFEPITRKFPLSNNAIKLALCLENSVPHAAVCIDQSKLSQPLVYSCSEKHEDYELWSRLALTETFINLPSALVNYRIHAEQYTKKTRYGLMTKCRFKFVQSLPLELKPIGIGLATIGIIRESATNFLSRSILNGWTSRTIRKLLERY